MNALDKIAELHWVLARGGNTCVHCLKPWPCPTRRLCDEASQERRVYEFVLLESDLAAATADRDRWKAAAERLAAELRCDGHNADLTLTIWDHGPRCSGCAALATHDVLGTVGST